MFNKSQFHKSEMLTGHNTFLQATNTKAKQNKGITGIIMNQEALQRTLLIIH